MRKKILVECCARKGYQCPSGETEDQRLYTMQRNLRNHSYF